MVGGGKCDVFQQGAECNVADMPIEVVNAMGASIRAMYDEVTFVNDFKPPWLGVVRAGRSARHLQNLL